MSFCLFRIHHLSFCEK